MVLAAIVERTVQAVEVGALALALAVWEGLETVWEREWGPATAWAVLELESGDWVSLSSKPATLAELKGSVVLAALETAPVASAGQE